ncbi:hypothetical protein ACH40E_02990 [Streptomyces acidicola]|uniref:hypothetical protein n=1 Tax=Streptomyces acidicola TaxID=2596892 RepID=UPI00379653B9
MKTFEDALHELAEDEGVYALLLTGDQARATLCALERAPQDDLDAAAARRRLAGLMERRAHQRNRAPEASDSQSQPAPPYDLPDADALLAFQASGRSRRQRRAQQHERPPLGGS